MIKEKLTAQRIVQDLKEKRKDTCCNVVGFAVGFVLFLSVFLRSIHSKNTFDIYRVMLGVSTLLMFLFLVAFVIETVTLSRAMKGKSTVVKSIVVDMNTIHWKHHIYYLYFPKYGRCPMEAGQYYYTHIGDEFYLILSKPNRGKILLTYHTDMYEWEEGGEVL